MVAETAGCRSPPSFEFLWLPPTFVADDMADIFPANVDNHRSDDKREK
jgi:hypothetical protein